MIWLVINVCNSTWWFETHISYHKENVENVLVKYTFTQMSINIIQIQLIDLFEILEQISHIRSQLFDWHNLIILELFDVFF